MRYLTCFSVFSKCCISLVIFLQLFLTDGSVPDCRMNGHDFLMKKCKAKRKYIENKLESVRKCMKNLDLA